MPQNPSVVPSTVIDARGLNCPLPVLRLRKALQALSTGTEVELLATDKAALQDVPAFCRTQGHDVLAVDTSDDVRFRIRKGASR
jgi:tRNA 2-thiouridine synthesizing protein A